MAHQIQLHLLHRVQIHTRFIRQICWAVQHPLHQVLRCLQHHPSQVHWQRVFPPCKVLIESVLIPLVLYLRWCQIQRLVLTPLPLLFVQGKILPTPLMVLTLMYGQPPHQTIPRIQMAV